MSSTPSFLRQPRTWLIAGVAVVVLFVGGWLVIDWIQGDAPERLSFEDLPSTTVAAGATTTVAASPGSTAGVDGTWNIAEGSQAGYRVKEVLFGSDAEAVGRTSDVTGSMVISGTTVTSTEVTVDMTTISSDRSQRDGQFQNRIMSTSEFPTATFELTEPIDFGAIPADGTEVTASATGELTLRGVTQTVTFDVTAKRTADQIAVNGTIPINFDDYEIPDASGGPATVGRDGEVELLLVFSR
jgi:polyisoprenoid-binding protein YceI